MSAPGTGDGGQGPDPNDGRPIVRMSAPKHVNSFRDLRVWQAGMELVQATYRFTRCFPTDEAFGLTGQMRRAAVSIPSNIAEGHTREHTGEFLHHLSIAQASLAELETQLEIAVRLEYCPAAQATALLALLTALGKQLYALRNAVMQRTEHPAPDPGPLSAGSPHPAPGPRPLAPRKRPC